MLEAWFWIVFYLKQQFHSLSSLINLQRILVSNIDKEKVSALGVHLVLFLGQSSVVFKNCFSCFVVYLQISLRPIYGGCHNIRPDLWACRGIGELCILWIEGCPVSLLDCSTFRCCHWWDATRSTSTLVQLLVGTPEAPPAVYVLSCQRSRTEAACHSLWPTFGLLQKCHLEPLNQTEATARARQSLFGLRRPSQLKEKRLDSALLSLPKTRGESWQRARREGKDGISISVAINKTFNGLKHRSVQTQKVSLPTECQLSVQRLSGEDPALKFFPTCVQGFSLSLKTKQMFS